MSSLGLKETYVGGAAQKLRGILDISHPIRQGSVQNWDDLEVLWSHILETELKTEGEARGAGVLHRQQVGDVALRRRANDRHCGRQWP